MTDLKRLAEEAHGTCPHRLKMFKNTHCQWNEGVACNWIGHAAIDALAAAGEEAERLAATDHNETCSTLAAVYSAECRNHDATRQQVAALTRQNEALRKALLRAAVGLDDAADLHGAEAARAALKETP